MIKQRHVFFSTAAYRESESALLQVCLHIQGICFHDRSYRMTVTEQKNTDNKNNEKEQVNKE